jgi:hypothetical protein
MNATLATELPRLDAGLRREKIAEVDPKSKPEPAKPKPQSRKHEAHEGTRARSRRKARKALWPCLRGQTRASGGRDRDREAAPRAGFAFVDFVSFVAVL